MKSLRIAALCLALVALLPAAGTAATITFEGFADSTALTNQYAGLAFSNATILTAGISLNEFDFPPHSGTNVAVALGQTMGLSFAAPVAYVGGYFTYVGAVTMTAYGAGNAVLGSVSSAFGSNSVSSGTPPTEFLSLAFAGIESVTFSLPSPTAAFTVDDIVYGDRPDAPVPEPASLLLLGTGIAGMAARRRRTN
jgi:hypothetical protein